MQVRHCERSEAIHSAASGEMDCCRLRSRATPDKSSLARRNDGMSLVARMERPRVPRPNIRAFRWRPAMNLKPIDRNALERAIERCRAEDAEHTE
jgi:hypothetical protein